MDFPEKQSTVNVKKELESKETITRRVQPIIFHSSYEASVEFPENNIKSEVSETSFWTDELNVQSFDDLPINEDFSTNVKLENSECNTFLALESISTPENEECSTDKEKSNEGWNDMLPNVPSTSSDSRKPTENILQCKICKCTFNRTWHFNKHVKACEKQSKVTGTQIERWKKLANLRSNSPDVAMGTTLNSKTSEKVIDVKEHQCPVCYKAFRRHSYYKEHVKICQRRLKLFGSQKCGNGKGTLEAYEISTTKEDITKQNSNQKLKETESAYSDVPNSKNVKQDALGRYICEICGKGHVNYYSHMRECVRRRDLVARDIDESVMAKKLSILQCPFCDKMYEREWLFYQHVDECAEIKELQVQQKLQAEKNPGLSWKVCETIPTENMPIKIESDNLVQTSNILNDGIRQTGPSLKCTNCSLRFLEIESLDAHIATAHANSKRQPTVSDSSDDDDVLFKDVLSQRIKQLKCSFCGKIYSVKGKKHYRMHKYMCAKKYGKNKGNGVEEELKRIMP